MIKKITFALCNILLFTSLQGSEIIKGSGASFPYTVYQKWLKAYNKETGIKIDFIKKGSSKGIKDVKARAVDFAGTDKPLSPKVLKRNKLYQFPSVVGAIIIGYNLPNIDNLHLSRFALVAIASGDVKFWDDPIISATNKEIQLPHKKLTFVHRADGSGTTYNFTYYLSKISKDWRKNYGAKKSLRWPGKQHIGGKTNSGIAALLKQTEYSLGYIDYTDAKNNDITMASLQNREGYFITPTLSSFQIAAAQAKLLPQRDFYAVITDPKGVKSYPMITATFILIPAEKFKKNKDIAKFYSWCYTKGKNIAVDLGFIPLPDSLVSKIEIYWKNRAITD